MITKIKQYIPYFEFVVNEQGELIDIEPYEPPITLEEPTEEIIQLSIEERLTNLETKLDTVIKSLNLII